MTGFATNQDCVIQSLTSLLPAISKPSRCSCRGFCFSEPAMCQKPAIVEGPKTRVWAHNRSS